MPILPALEPLPSGPDDEVARWAASGTMALTGRAGGPPLGPPAGLVPKLDALGARLTSAAAALGASVSVDVVSLLGERAALTGLGRRGTTSCGGASRLLPCRDGWIAASLARREDVDLVPAWLSLAGPPADPWAAIAAAAATAAGAALVDRARLLGLPAAWLPAGATPTPVSAATTPLGDADPALRLADVRVVELGALWAGPLCGSLLVAAGADVVKVESTGRPDGARRGPPAFFDLCNAGKRSVAVDLATPTGRRDLASLVATADVVIEGSRPRALEQLGVDATTLIADGGPRTWVSITGYGRHSPARGWTAFGDDAAVAGGLVSWDADGPVFCADAIADPTTGVVAAAAVLESLATGERQLLDVPLAAVAAHLAGPTLDVPRGVGAAAPRARARSEPGPALGAHTAEVLAERRRPR